MSKAATAFRTISEVSDELKVPKHVLRFWEAKFPQIKPMKRGGGRRYYRPEDMSLLKGICHLLHAEAYTIKGVQKILRERGVDAVKALSDDDADAQKPAKKAPAKTAAKSVTSKAGRKPAKASAAKASKKPAARRRAEDVEAQSIDPDILTALNNAISELQACRSALLGTPPARKAKGRSTRAVRS
ncbi:MAG: MerR family transcriptional regulator [Filomicrobium sp.]